MIKIENLDLCKIKIDENSFKNIFIYYIEYKIKYSVKSLYLINKINRYIKENNENNYITLLTTDESKETLKKYKELWSKSTFRNNKLKT